MALKYPGEWKFDGIGEGIPREAVSDFYDLLLKIASGQPERRHMLEGFKAAFGRSSYSTDEGWAETDLYSAMEDYAENAVLFIDALWSEIESLAGKVPVPTAGGVNKILARHDVPLVVDPPSLMLKRGDVEVVPSAEDDESRRREAGHVYVQGDELGRGGYGIVYRVSRQTTVADFEFAMKVLDPSPFNENVERSLARFRREIAILKRLQHRSIMPYIEAGIDRDGRPYILMPLIEGLDLHKALSARDLPTVIQAFREILQGLEYAHSLDIVHRDLKPSNVIVRASDQQPIILDFGCAYTLDGADSASLTTTLIGSMGYIPSEVISNPKLRSPLHDVYACGIMLYEVLSGSRPDPAAYGPLALMNVEWKAIDRVIRDAIAPAPSRISSAAAFLDRLLDL